MHTSDEKSRNVFASRNYRLVFFGALVSELGSVLYSFAVSFYILEISSNNAFLQGLYLALTGLTLLLLTPVGGVLGDRYNKAAIMFVCDYLKGGLILLATFSMLLLRSGSAHIVILFVIGILGSAVSGIFSPAAGALLPHIVPEQKLQQANSYFSARSAMQSILGVVLAGVLYAALPIQLLFLIVGFCYVFSGVSEMFIRYDHQKKDGKLTLRLMFSDMKGGIVYLRTQKAIMALMAVILFINFFASPLYGNFLPYFVKTDVAGAGTYLFDRLLTPELWSSVFSMLLGVSSLAGAIFLSTRTQKDKIGRQTSVLLLLMSALMIGVTVAYWILVARSISLNAFLILLCAGFFAVGFLVSFLNIPFNTVMMRVVDRNQLSKVNGILSIFSQGLIPLASVLAGIVLQTAGCTVLLLVCSLGFTGAALFLLFSKEARNI